MNLNTDIYELVEKEDLKDLKSEGILLKHRKSGARVVLMKNEDPNKVFYIGFRTPVDNSTGVAHILEHSVLCGSRDFPVKDPFVELVKGSLNTFLNAMTYPDKTVYPVASCNEKDFQNLMHVYMDAVFYPNIYRHREIFQQEGWSYHLEETDGELTYNGVVYNEMKGAFSSPEGVLDRVILNSLFPDTNYACESGGDPEVIPTLTYEQFLNFHRTYYHPSNSYIFLYGDMDMEEKLTWLDENYLCDYDEKKVDSQIEIQKPFGRMEEITTTYSIGENEEEEDHTYLSYNKVIGTSLDPELYLAFQILDYALLSAPGAPLKRALTEAGIGKDVMGSYDNGIYQPIFSIIAKGANREQKKAFVQTVEETLRKLAEEGIDSKALEAGLNYYEFRYREADFGNYPKGLIYGLQILDSWLYDDDKPFIHVEALDTFTYLKGRIGKGYFEQLVQEFLLDNPHGSVVIVAPEKGRTARMEQALKEGLSQYKDKLTPEQVERLVMDTRQLEAYQEAPESQEELKKIPLLSVEDISREPRLIRNEEMKAGTVPLLYHEVETNGIGYGTLLFDLSGVSEDLLPYVGVLQAVLGIIDTTNFEYGELFNEINRYTGGIGTSLEVYPNVEKAREKEFKATFEVKVRALYEKLPFALDMVREILRESKLEDEKRLKEILDMTKSRMQMRFLSSGHTTAVMRAMSYSSPVSRFKDLTEGIAFYQVVSRLTEQFDEEKAMLITTLKDLAKQIFCGDRLMVSYTASRGGLREMPSLIRSFQEELWSSDSERGERDCTLHCEKRNEGFRTASKVQYVARSGNFLDSGWQYTGALQILKVVLSYDYLWQNIRVKGGAYGCMSGFNRMGEGYLVSYRDPHLRRTNEIYEGVVDYLEHFAIEERDMTKFIIGTVSSMDQPLTPGADGERSLNLYMSHVTEEMLKKERAQVLDATAADIRALAQIVESVLQQDEICVIGSEEKIDREADLFDHVNDLL